MDENVIDYGFGFDEPGQDGEGFDMAFDIGFMEETGNRYLNPKPFKGVPQRLVRYEHAQDAADNIELAEGSRSHALISGNFEAGDFIEALLTRKNIRATHMSISTLSMNENNVDSLVNLIDGGYLDRLDLIVSDYFFSHERNGLVPYILHELDRADRFQFAVAGVHTKITAFETFGGHKVIIHGSANLRSSGCIEQITIEENPELYGFYREYHDRIIAEYSIINKSIRRNALWQVVAKREAEADPGKKADPRPRNGRASTSGKSRQRQRLFKAQDLR